jgi:aspartate carbamoyltransferase catalytic subunit
VDRDAGGEVIDSIVGRDLLSVEGLSRAAILEILDLAEAFAEVNTRAVRKVPTLKGSVVASLFFEESTRTRLSFETAAKRLSADVLSLAVAASSVKKGESLRDTVATIDALGIDAVVLRHASSGAPEQVSRFVPHVRVINAGDGQHQHPTQGLLDAFTVRAALAQSHKTTGRDSGAELFDGLRVLIVGDVRHSRVARSDAFTYAALGATVRVCAPGTLLPDDLGEWPVEVAGDFDVALADSDVVALLRLQRERGSGEFVPSLGEYTATHGLTWERARALSPATLITHPGPMNRGVEIDSRVTSLPNVLVERQVASGVPVRMSVLYLALSAAGSRAGDD